MMAFDDALEAVAGERGAVNVKRLGRWVAKLEGRIVDGMRFASAGDVRGVRQWIVELASSEGL